MVKVRVEELKDIPASVVIGEGHNFQTDSLTVPVVIIQQQMLGTEAPDVDPIPNDGNPHPRPHQPHFHPNQHNHFLGPIQQHEAEHEQQPNAGNQAQDELELQLVVAQQQQVPNLNIPWDMEEEEEADLPGWGHWAMPHDHEEIDQEPHPGEFLHLNELMEPMMEDEHAGNAEEPQVEDNNSNLTLSLVPSHNSISTEASANGPLAPIIQNVPDLNQVAGLDMLPDGPPMLAQGLNGPPNPGIQMQNNDQRHMYQEDWNLQAILQQDVNQDVDLHQDPMHYEIALPKPSVTVNIQMNIVVYSPKMVDTEILPSLNLQTITDPSQDTQMMQPIVRQMENTGDNSHSDCSAPPGFPDPIYSKYAPTNTHAEKEHMEGA